MDDNHEFCTVHLPHLVSYVVTVLQSKNDAIEIGSGVLVSAGGRHFVATAWHCIDADPRVVRSSNPVQETGNTGAQPVHVIGRGRHDTLDLGYLEIADPECATVTWDQLCNDRITSGLVHFVGYPEVLVETAQSVPGRLTDVFLVAGSFGTTLKEETDERMAFDYPTVGARYDKATGTWRETAFPKTPRGFSGGGCFGVARTLGLVTRIQYKLLAIQYAWNERDSVFAVPIRHWRDLLNARGLV